ncbi:hypothetical protein I7I51_01233 [Histoplasma capsulatum]|uniref:Lipoprotein n=1 Tax=Ajellomyces capsulatus TaxID=5037 RepID=A0A8A1ME05_AJECA|nr:hypothetical protein I7I51_01233 [Histoplasma capsulatum]
MSFSVKWMSKVFLATICLFAWCTRNTAPILEPEAQEVKKQTRNTSSTSVGLQNGNFQFQDIPTTGQLSTAITTSPLTLQFGPLATAYLRRQDPALADYAVYFPLLLTI